MPITGKCRAVPWLLAAALLPGLAAAHGDDAGFDPQDLIMYWNPDPLILGLSGLALGCFVAGVLRRGKGGRPVAGWRRTAFVAGLAMVVAALVSPLDAMADHAFWAHQIQHMLLRVTGPLLIMAAAPQAVVLAGMPRFLRRGLIAPVGRSGPLRTGTITIPPPTPKSWRCAPSSTS